VEDWKRVLWSDETKINRIGSDGRSYTWKQWGAPLCDCTTTPTVKHGGGNNLMVWGYTVPYPQVGTHPQVGSHICHESSQVVTVPGFKLRQVCRDGDMTMRVVSPSRHSTKILLFYFAHCACCYNMYKNAMDITAINTIKAMRSRHEKCYSVASYTDNM